MKKLLCYLLLVLPLASCSILKHQETALGNQVVLERNEDEILITETFSYREELAAVNENTAEDLPEASFKKETLKHQKAQSLDNELTVSVKDTIYIYEDQVAIALESERIAKNAHVWSFIPLLTFLFLPALPLGIIMTFVLIGKVKKMPYVTQIALDQVRKARRTLFWTTVGQIIIAIVLIALIILLALAFL